MLLIMFFGRWSFRIKFSKEIASYTQSSATTLQDGSFLSATSGGHARHLCLHGVSSVHKL